MKADSPLAPSSSPTACARIVFPAPVSPVIAFRPGANASSASRIRTRFSIRSLRSKGLAVAAEEGVFGERRELAALLAEAYRHARAGRKRCDRVPVSEQR